MSDFQSQATIRVAFSESGDSLDVLEESSEHVSTSSAPSQELADSRPMIDSINQLEREIAFVSEKLEAGSYDPHTGQFRPNVTGAERERMEQHRAMLNVSLRDQQALEQQRVAAVAQRQADAAARQKAVEARAVQILEEQGIEADAQKLAEMLRASRT